MHVAWWIIRYNFFFFTFDYHHYYLYKNLIPSYDGEKKELANNYNEKDKK